MRAIHFLAGGLVVWASSAFAVSQIGGGKCFDPAQGYSAPLPKSFSRGLSNGHGVIQLFGRNFSQTSWSGGIGGYEALVIEDLVVSNPHAAQISDRGLFIENWTALGWTGQQTANPCVVLLMKDNATSHNAVLAWGEGHGIELTAPATPEASDAIAELVNGLQLDPGACTWK